MSAQHKEWIDIALKSCIDLSLMSDCVATCCQYLHRVCEYANQDADTTQFEIGNVVAACILIATKACECEIRLSTLIKAVYDKVTKMKIDTEGEDYWKLRQSVVNMESTILRILNFDMTVDVPHKYVMFYLKSLTDWMGSEKLMDELTVLSVSLLNDYYCSNMSSYKHKPTWIALICIDTAIDIIAPNYKELIKSSESSHPWYQNFDKSFHTENFDLLKNELKDTYPC